MKHQRCHPLEFNIVFEGALCVVYINENNAVLTTVFNGSRAFRTKEISTRHMGYM